MVRAAALGMDREVTRLLDAPIICDVADRRAVREATRDADCRIDLMGVYWIRCALI